MRIEHEHVVDASEPDASGTYDYYYEYDLWRFVAGDLAVVARSYVDNANEVSFIRKERGGKKESLHVDDLRGQLIREACVYLAGQGKSEFCWLDSERGEYVGF